MNTDQVAGPVDAHPAFRAVDGKDHGEEEKEHGEHPDDNGDTDSDVMWLLWYRVYQRSISCGTFSSWKGEDSSTRWLLYQPRANLLIFHILSLYFKFCIKIKTTYQEVEELNFQQQKVIPCSHISLI